MGCSKPSNDIEITAPDVNADTADQPIDVAPIERVTNVTPVTEAFQEAAIAAITETVEQCKTMQQRVYKFLSAPNEQSQTDAQLAFAACHQRWTASAIYFNEPFNLNEATGLRKLVGLIDTRPYLAGHIDGIPDYPYSGLIHELELVINADTLRGQHRLMDEESASLGFPVVEFFLWKGPLQEHWQAQTEEELQNLVNRRLTYLKLATDQLLDQLAKASFRWRRDGEFNELPDRAKLNLEIKSIQRFTMVDMLNRIFADSALEEPEWVHPAQFAGDGRGYILSQLAQLTTLIGAPNSATPLTLWIDKEELIDTTGLALQNSLAQAIAAVQQLPVNYPFDSAADEQWDAARQAMAQLALEFTKVSQQLKLNVVTQ
jgi:hypothetical protein